MGRKLGGTNSVQKPQGKQTSIWLDADCLETLEELKGKSQGKTICAALRLAKRHPEEFREILAQRDSD